MNNFMFKQTIAISVLVALVFVGAGCNKSEPAPKNDGGIYKSQDAGQTWRHTVAFPTAQGVGSIATTDVMFLEIDRSDSQVIYAGTKEDGLLMTIDGASTWQQTRDPAFKTGMVSAIGVDATDVCTLYIGKGQKLSKSTDCMRSFKHGIFSETREGITIAAIEVDWFNPKVVWMGLSNGDIMKSTDGGNSWRKAYSVKSTVTGIVMNPTDSRKMMIGTSKSGIYKTSDGGERWVPIRTPVKNYQGALEVHSIVQDDASTKIYIATKYGLLYSTDFGTSWKPVKLLSEPGQVDITALAVDPKNPKNIYYAVENVFYSSVDGGVTWVTNKVATTRQIASIAIDHRNSAIVYIGTKLVAKKK
ncbi:MAG: YCF48-related protein [Patescibacteria group bacterium]